eukprot:Colp12_sorted_trinity150504_noHs@35000
MKIRADLSQAVWADSNKIEWIGAGQGSNGVSRRMLDRDGDQVARATTVVRFNEDSAFPEHSHGGGEEFFVLDGVFSDETGHMKKGTYVRNPIDSKHAPYTKEGCTILVKLRQMTDKSESPVVVDTNEWADKQKADKSGSVAELPLFYNESTKERVFMQFINAGSSTEAPTDIVEGGWEFFVYEGQITLRAEDAAKLFAAEYLENGVVPQLGERCWARLPRTNQKLSLHNTSSTPAILLVKTGHLRD